MVLPLSDIVYLPSRPAFLPARCLAAPARRRTHAQPAHSCVCVTPKSGLF